MSSGISEPRTETSTQQTGSKLRDGERRLMELDSGPEIQPNAAAGLQLQQRASAVERAGAESGGGTASRPESDGEVFAVRRRSERTPSCCVSLRVIQEN